ncbi:fibronectin type III domain-containing protein [Flavobacterium sp. GT3P67]|uniref:fibronectin type III domain-containing protein n=1 Tax=Flavobacterium sp. GT3P67 TaxID=2541722 RepID=UPI001053B74F|nr:fibronectin type III domain-containing protein [Flavobacterium sp. GT3P67]TDE53750.1 fibronectin type III domain-containing protein [Flavobacterium sp. GT3P67]
MIKYLILLFTVLSFGQASNQMVSYTQAQSLGFALNSGQSHVTSTQCMTKTEALAKYNLNASSMSAYASNQLVPKSAWVSAVVYYTYTLNLGFGEGVSATCSDNSGAVQTVYSSQSGITMPMTFYSNTALTTTFPAGGYTYYFPSGNELLTINNSGSLTSLAGCAAADTAAPSTPSNLSPSLISPTNVYLDWFASTDNVGVTGYEIHRSTVSSTSGFIFINTSLTNTYSDLSVVPNTTYWYKVRAYDAAGNLSGFSNIVSQYTFQ